MGPGNHVYDLSTTLARGGMDVTVITVNDRGSRRKNWTGLKFCGYTVRPALRDIVSWAVQLNVAMLEKAIQAINREGRFISFMPTTG